MKLSMQRIIVVAALLTNVLSGSSIAQESEVATLNAKIAELSRARQYSEAIPMAQRALSIIEAALRPDDLHFAPALTRLADLYRTQSLYAEAEPLYVRALAVREKGLGPDHPEVAASLQNLASLYTAQGRNAEAQPLLDRAALIQKNASAVRRSGPIPATRVRPKPLGVR
jgi:tetratricopeptide (TPR) repeat protein